MPPENTHRWRSLYERAMRETDEARLADRIEQAQEAIIERSRQLAVLEQFDEEDTELTHAILLLCDLRRNRRRMA